MNVKDVKNITIIDNIITLNSGIYFERDNSDVHLISNNIFSNYYCISLDGNNEYFKITNNTFEGNLSLALKRRFHDSLIFGNRFNCSMDIQINNYRLYTDEKIPLFNNSYLGNFWNNYTGLDNDGDGIGDIPYQISEDFFDYFPVVDISLLEMNDNNV